MKLQDYLVKSAINLPWEYVGADIVGPGAAIANSKIVLNDIHSNPTEIPFAKQEEFLRSLGFKGEVTPSGANGFLPGANTIYARWNATKPILAHEWGHSQQDQALSSVALALPGLARNYGSHENIYNAARKVGQGESLTGAEKLKASGAVLAGVPQLLTEADATRRAYKAGHGGPELLKAYSTYAANNTLPALGYATAGYTAGRRSLNGGRDAGEADLGDAIRGTRAAIGTANAAVKVGLPLYAKYKYQGTNAPPEARIFGDFADDVTGLAKRTVAGTPLGGLFNEKAIAPAISNSITAVNNPAKYIETRPGYTTPAQGLGRGFAQSVLPSAGNFFNPPVVPSSDISERYRNMDRSMSDYGRLAAAAVPASRVGLTKGTVPVAKAVNSDPIAKAVATGLIGKNVAVPAGQLAGSAATASGINALIGKLAPKLLGGSVATVPYLGLTGAVDLGRNAVSGGGFFQNVLRERAKGLESVRGHLQNKPAEVARSLESINELVKHPIAYGTGAIHDLLANNPDQNLHKFVGNTLRSPFELLRGKPWYNPIMKPYVSQLKRPDYTPSTNTVPSVSNAK